MIELKITMMGNAPGVIFPKELMEKLGVNEGDTLYLLETGNGFELTPHNPEFLKQVAIAQEVMKEDQNVLRKLSQ